MTHKDHGYYYSSRRARAAVTSRVLYGTTNEISRFTKNNASAHALRAQHTGMDERRKGVKISKHLG